MKRNILIILILTFVFVDIQASEQSQKPTAILIGAAGKQGQDYFNLLKNDVIFKAFIVSANALENNEQRKFLEKAKETNIKVLIGLDGLKEALENEDISFEIAIISLPHYLHESFTTPLLQAGKTIIKEKPLALNNQEVLNYEKNSKLDYCSIFTIVQRHFQDSLLKAKEELHLIGDPISFNYEYAFNLSTITAGWRASKIKSGGGVVIDMGYHIIDVVNDFFGMPDVQSVNAIFSYYHEEMRKEGLEDVANINLIYFSGLKGKITFSRHSTRKELFVIEGSQGKIEIDPSGYTVFDIKENILRSYKASQTKDQNKLDMLKSYINAKYNKEYIKQEFSRHKNNVLLIDRIYEVAQTVKL